MCAVPNTKPRRQFPTAFTILFLIMLLAIALTWIIPAGAYAKLSYNPASESLMVNSPQGDISRIPATQEALAKLNLITHDPQPASRADMASEGLPRLHAPIQPTCS
ncbi:hypothetical protein [Aeromonas allosaccharophila]|uniref:hypothetical protein n=1 Tax=Aeromonas allosaccharophila TaxID=656 RepID=UPI003AF7AB68